MPNKFPIGFATILTPPAQPKEELTSCSSGFSHVLKFNPYHDEVGRFSSEGGAKFVSVSGVFSGRKNVVKPTVESGLSALETAGILSKSEYGYYLDGDRSKDVLTTLGDTFGFTKKPLLKSKEDIDALVEAGGIELFRGETDAEYVTQYKTGEVHYGTGCFGSGTYMAGYGSSSKSSETRDGAIATAKSYAGGTSPESRVMRSVLPKDANILDYKDLLNAMQSEYRAMADEARWSSDLFEQACKDKKISPFSDEGDKLYDTLRKEHEVKAKSVMDKQAKFEAAFVNESAYAMSKGYDAVRVHDSGYYVVFNRGKLTMEK